MNIFYKLFYYTSVKRHFKYINLGIGCGVSMIGLGTYMYYKYQWDNAVPQIAPIASWFPVACIFIFTITCTVGFLVVPWVMIGELYPQKVRGIVGGMTTCMAHTFVFIVVKTYPFLVSMLNRHGTFILYGCISFLGKLNRRQVQTI